LTGGGDWGNLLGRKIMAAEVPSAGSGQTGNWGSNQRAAILW